MFYVAERSKHHEKQNIRHGRIYSRGDYFLMITLNSSPTIPAASNSIKWKLSLARQIMLCIQNYDFPSHQPTINYTHFGVKLTNKFPYFQINLLCTEVCCWSQNIFVVNYISISTLPSNYSRDTSSILHRNMVYKHYRYSCFVCTAKLKIWFYNFATFWLRQQP